MALQTTGPISLLDVATEFKDTAPHSLSEFYGAGGAPASGSLSLSDFYGLSDRSSPEYLSAGTSGTWVVPSGVTSITVQIAAGGGSGAGDPDYNLHLATGGGYAGQVKKLVLSVSPGQNINYSVGLGGAESRGNGTAGGNSVFGATTCLGGAGGVYQIITNGGDASVPFAGNGAARVSDIDGLTYYDGTATYQHVDSYGWITIRRWGGQASALRNGANGGVSGYWSAGGGGGYIGGPGRSGGHGSIYVSW